MNDKNNKFSYTYSAPTIEERREIEGIRKQYLPNDEKETKLNRLKKLDARVKNIPLCYSLVLGIIGLLVFGLGLTMVLQWKLYTGGIIISIIGIGIMLPAYPLHQMLLKKGKEKFGPEILELSNSLLNSINE